MGSLRPFIIGGCLASLTAFDASAETRTELIEKGRAILEANCARCHAIGKDDVSKHPEAPPFREVMKRYPPDNLAEALAEGIISGHPDMPSSSFSRRRSKQLSAISAQ